MRYLITKELAEEHGIPINRLEKVFDYITFDDFRLRMEERDYNFLEDDEIETLSNFIISKFEDEHLERIISYLEYRGILYRQ